MIRVVANIRILEYLEGSANLKTLFPVDRDKLEYLIDRLPDQEILILVIRSCSAHDSMGIKQLALLVKPLPHHSFLA